MVHVPNFGGLSGSEDRGGGDNSIQFINIGRVGDKCFKEWRQKIGGWKKVAYAWSLNSKSARDHNKTFIDLSEIVVIPTNSLEQLSDPCRLSLHPLPVIINDNALIGK